MRQFDKKSSYLLDALIVVILITLSSPKNVFPNNKKYFGYVPDEIFIKFKPSVRVASKNALHQALGSVMIKEFREIGWQHIKLPKNSNVGKMIEELRSNPNLEYAEPNYNRRIAITPNDSRFYDQWGLLKINAPSAWDMNTGFEGTIVAVIDTGVAYEHPDLNINVWRNTNEIPENGIDDDANGYIDDVYGWNFTDDNNNPSDYNSHGTQVGGIIGAAGNNSSGVTGLNWRVRIMPLKVSDALGNMSTDRIISATIYAVDNGAKVINASYGSYDYSQAEHDSISYANSKGVLFVAAAGNESNNNDNLPHYPSNYNLPNVISVAATDENDQLANFSNFGLNTVHVAAPGVNILSTIAGRKAIFYDNFNDISSWDHGCNLRSGGNCSYTPGIVSGYWEDSPYNLYDNNSLAYLEMKNPIDISSEQAISLKLFSYINSEVGYDFLSLKIADEIIDEKSGELGWFSGEYDISQHKYSPLRLRFEFQTDETVQYDGIRLDYVEIKSYRPATAEDMEQFSGTSMATPFVSGLAALLLSLNQNLSVSESKNIILSSVDELQSLSGCISSTGRINAHKAISSVNCTPPFHDVLCTHWAKEYIRAIREANITTGCGVETYCPNSLVTREQMAAFIVRAKEGEPAANYCDSDRPFSDVTSDMWSCKYIKRLKELRITTGYADDTYRPANNVTRAEMATFLIRGVEGELPDEYCDSGLPFVDVMNDWSCKYIKRLKELNITTGYGDGTYRPANNVTREEMAAFLWRAFLR